MNIQLLNERVQFESQLLQLCVRQRLWLHDERLARLEQLIPMQQAILAEVVDERQDLLDNHNRIFWRPGTRLNPEMEHLLSSATYSSLCANRIWIWL